jgi:hypothetical protein
MNATLDPPVAFAMPPLTASTPPEPARGDGPRRIGLIMTDVLARHGLSEADVPAATPRRSA